MEKRGKELSRQDDLLTNEDEFFKQFPPSRVKKLLGDANEHMTGMGIGWNLDTREVMLYADVIGSKASKTKWVDNNEPDFFSLDIEGVEIEDEVEDYKPMVTLQFPVTKQYVRQSIKELGRKVEQYRKELNDKQ